MSIPFQIRQLDHVVLRVRDVATMRRFYCQVLGCTFEREQAEIGLLQLRAGASLIDLIDVNGKLGRKGGAAPAAEARNVDHFCLQVDAWDKDAILAHLRTHAVRIGEVGERYGAEGNGPSIYIDDPEGNTVELKGPPDPLEV